jgi:3-hydroxy-9,10-secoandrosta-1,3,5(10)-triene-9,17-dione monooxygenase reductase component
MSSAMADLSIDPLQFRRVLGYFPTGVTVVTACTAQGRPVGVTIGSFSSVSLDPPLVGFLPMINSDRWPEIRTTGVFCVNVLAADQGELCWQFARTTVEEPFDGVEWRPSTATGSPILGTCEPRIGTERFAVLPGETRRVRRT